MKSESLTGNIVRYFIESKITPLVIFAAVFLGLGAVVVLPREEEPQIVVPMVDVFVKFPGATARETELRVTTPMEKLLWEVPGVEYVYSTTTPGESMVVVRFLVGQNEEAALVRLNQKLQAHFDLIPPGAEPPIVKPRSIDDVPILAFTFWSKTQDGLALRRIAAEVENVVKRTPDVSETTLTGGERRQLRISIDSAKLAGFNLAADQVQARLAAANLSGQTAGATTGNRETLVQPTATITDAATLGDIVVGGTAERPVHLRDVAAIADGPEEPTSFVRFVPVGKEGGSFPAVTLSVAKRKGTNAVDLAHAVEQRVEELRGRVIPSDVSVTVTRNYGETAAEKSNELLWHMGLAVLSVMILIGLMLGKRESVIVGIAIPVTLALTLSTFYFLGFTLNRITLFALIFSIGILVDDPIVDVENIVRHFRMPENRGRSKLEITIEAVNEVRSPLILATLAVMAAILPMAFVGGLMGPYMRPIPIGASAAMLFSMAVAFIVTPWAAYKVLGNTSEGHGGHAEGEPEDRLTRLYRRLMGRIIYEKKIRNRFLFIMIGLLLGAFALVPLKAVIVKMLPFDDKSEFQVVVDMPEGTPLEETGAVASELAAALARVTDVRDVQVYAGTAAPYNFNGLVRHYFLRRGPNVADLQVNLVGKAERSRRSHVIAKEARPLLEAIGKKYGARLKIAEVPPGPPVLSTLVAEIYGPDYAKQVEVARRVRDVFDKTDGVADVDWYGLDPQKRAGFEIDREKAAWHGVSEAAAVGTLDWALRKRTVGLVHFQNEREDVPIVLETPRAARANPDAALALRISTARGGSVGLREIVRVKEDTVEQTIYHKNLMPVVYVTGDVAGRQESPVYAILKLDAALDELKMPDGAGLARYVTRLPETDRAFAMKWDGEWHITYEVFRDLGLAFGVVLLLIYVLTVAWFKSFVTPLVIMAAIPFSLVGILPAHAGFGIFFTATSMIGFIAGAGIVVRNSIILVDFIELRLSEGMPLAEAVIDAGAVRFRPMVLTAAAVIVGAGVILLDPIFQGLALSLIAGEIASLLLSRVAVPTLYYLVNRKSHTPVSADSGERPVEEFDAAPVGS